MANVTVTCSTCGKKFFVIDKEQNFLKDKGLPLSTDCPSCRQLRRLRLRGERSLYKTTCSKCDKEIIVSYDPKTAKNPILCKEDYEKYFLENDPIITDPLPDA